MRRISDGRDGPAPRPRPLAHRRLGLARVVLAAALATAGMTAGRAQPGPPPAAAATDAKFEVAKAAFEALSDADRSAIQDALVWSGDYASTTTGAFGRRTYDGILAYQKRIKAPETGILDQASVRSLRAASDRAKAAAGFASMVDTATGIRLGLPSRLLPKRSPNGSGGTRFQSADGRVTLDTREASGGEAELKELFEKTVAVATPGRKVTYRLLRPDFFVITGETANGRFYTRYAAGAGGLRGFSLGYDKALAKEYETVVVAISNSFDPFPSGGRVAAARPDQPAAPPPAGGGVVQGAAGLGAQTGPVPQAGATVFTGLAIGSRRVLTTAKAEGCREIQVAGAKARVIRSDPSGGTLLLEGGPDRRPLPLRLGAQEPKAGDSLVVVFVGTEDGRRTVAAPAEATDRGRLVAPLQAGAAGGVVADRAGRLVGLIGSLAEAPRQVAGLVPPASYPILGVGALRAGLGPDASAAAEGGGDALSVGAIAAQVAPALVPIACAAEAKR